MHTTAQTVRSSAVTTPVSLLQPGAVTTTSDDYSVNLQPPTWNEIDIPYMGDLSPKPTWEIIIKVGYTVRNAVNTYLIVSGVWPSVAHGTLPSHTWPALS